MTLSDTEIYSSDIKLYLYTSVSAFVGFMNRKFNSLEMPGINNVQISASSITYSPLFMFFTYGVILLLISTADLEKLIRQC